MKNIEMPKYNLLKMIAHSRIRIIYYLYTLRINIHA